MSLNYLLWVVLGTKWLDSIQWWVINCITFISFHNSFKVEPDELETEQRNEVESLFKILFDGAFHSPNNDNNINTCVLGYCIDLHLVLGLNTGSSSSSGFRDQRRTNIRVFSFHKCNLCPCRRNHDELHPEGPTLKTHSEWDKGLPKYHSVLFPFWRLATIWEIKSNYSFISRKLFIN